MNFAKLPMEVLGKIVAGLTYTDLGALIRVDEETYTSISSRDWFWKTMFWTFYQLLPINVDNWATLFKKRHTRWYPLETEMFDLEDHNQYILKSDTSLEFCLVYSPQGGVFRQSDSMCGNWYQLSHLLEPVPLCVEGTQVLYYEITVKMEIQGHGNGLGLMLKGADLNHHMPGWEQGSYAMHSDDGNAYYNNSPSIYSCKSFAYGPSFQRNGAVIGCGYNFKTKEVFFTQEGQFIGVAFTLPNQVEVGGIVPCIGMHTPRSTWAVNLGKYPFKFNIDAYICGDNIEKLEGFQYEERESNYLVTRQQIDEMAARGENFLNVFIPSSTVQEIVEQ